jgi:hypothetical protein
MEIPGPKSLTAVGWGRLLMAGALLLGWFGLLPGVAWAGPPRPEGSTMQECIACHEGQVPDVALEMTFTDGETISVYVEPNPFLNSVHGSTLQCTACHQEIQGYPHQDRSVVHPTVRDAAYLIRQYSVCGDCHLEAYTTYLGSRHAKALAEGNGEAAICSDCHGQHNIEEVGSGEVGLTLRPAVYSCSKCHEEEFVAFQQSVHGRPLLEQGDPNMPACIDCHGVHHIADPTTPEFRRQSPYLCATCHADQTLMREYGLSTQIMDSYVSDFHGTTAHLFPAEEGKVLNQAVCHDCHGAHDIRSTIDPESSIIRQNLLETCQKCHEAATVNFPDAWLGHYPPSPYENAPVYWIRAIYLVILTGGMAGLISHVALDMGRVTIDKVKKEKLSHE